MKRHKNMAPHPLERIAREAFAENDHQDGTSLALFFAGAWMHGKGWRAYRTVALDVLGYMESQGRLKRNAAGWWCPVRVGQAVVS